MLLEKSRHIKQRFRGKGISLEIRCKANVLPLKAIMYAMAHANRYMVRPKNSNTSLYVHKLVAQTKYIESTINRLRKSLDISPSSHSSTIRSALDTYVDLFYTASKDERKSYIELFNNGRRTKIKPERNLLIVPALMAELKQPKEDVCNGLFYALYRMPFKILYDASKCALHVALLEQNMAIRTVPYETVENFSKSMSKLESKINAVGKGGIDPQDDEDIKADFIEKAMEFSKATEINIVDLISEKVGTEGAVLTRMHRIIRRARY